jgi:hypothetical protein
MFSRSITDDSRSITDDSRSINDTSRVVKMTIVSDAIWHHSNNSIGVIYNRNVSIIQATGDMVLKG